MSAVAPIVVSDAQATPENHSFIPLGQDTKGVWWFEDQQSGTAPIGWNRMSIAITRPSNPAPGAVSSDRLSRVKLSIHTPVLETLSNNSAGFTPSPTVAYIPRVNVEFLLPDRANGQNRKDLRRYAIGLLGDDQVINAVENLQSVY